MPTGERGVPAAGIGAAWWGLRQVRISPLGVSRRSVGPALRAWAQAAGGRLIVAADSEPKNLHPAIVASNGVFFIASKVIEPLAEASYEGENGLAPRLATSWEGSADGLSVTFKLREGVTWPAGPPFTADALCSRFHIFHNPADCQTTAAQE